MSSPELSEADSMLGKAIGEGQKVPSISKISDGPCAADVQKGPARLIIHLRKTDDQMSSTGSKQPWSRLICTGEIALSQPLGLA